MSFRLAQILKWVYGFGHLPGLYWRLTYRAETQRNR